MVLQLLDSSGASPISSTQGFFLGSRQGGRELPFIMLFPRDSRQPQQPWPSLCTESPHPARAEPALQAALLGTGLDFHQDFSWLSATPGLAPSGTQSPPGLCWGSNWYPGTPMSPVGLSHQHRDLAPACCGHHRGRCPFIPSALGSVGGWSQHPAELRKGMKVKPNCPSPIPGVTALTPPSHLRTVRPTWRFSILRLGNSVRPPQSPPGASPFPAADKTLSRSPHTLLGRVSAQGPGKR